LSEIPELSEDTFFDFIASNKVALIDCYTDWCMPCKRMAPLLPSLSESLTGKAVIGKVNIETEKWAQQMYEIKSIPTFLFFVDGAVKQKLVGSRTIQELKQTAEQLFNGE